MRISGVKGQVNIEFLGAAFIYLASLGALILASQSILPEFSSNVHQASLNLEAKQVSDKLLTTPGRHSFGGERTKWQKNDTTIEHTSSIGLASNHLVLERQKIMNLRTINPQGSSTNYFNYSQFKEVTGVRHQYRFKFTWMPVVETNGSFTKGEGLQNTPSIVEPDSDYYNQSGNTIHYGSEELNGNQYRFLVTSHNDVYNTTYVSEDWDFQTNTEGPVGVDGTFNLNSESFKVESFQNRDEDKGSLLVLSQQLKTFGANLESGTEVISLDRYASMENEPVKVRVWTW